MYITGTTIISGESGPESNGYESVVYIPKSSGIGV